MAYFSNGSEGAVLEEQCSECPLGNGPCPVSEVHLIYNYDQVRPGQEKLRAALNVLVDERGVCQVREQMKQAGLMVKGRGGQSRTTRIET